MRHVPPAETRPLSPQDPRIEWGQAHPDNAPRFGPTGSAFADPQTRPEQPRPVESQADYRRRMEDIQDRFENGGRVTETEHREMLRYEAEQDARRAELQRQQELRKLGLAPTPDPGRGTPLGSRMGLDEADPRSGLRDGDLSRMYSTPAGMSVFPDHEVSHRASAAMVRPDPHSFTVDLHGTPGGVLFNGTDGGRVDPHTLATVIRANPDWAANPRPIRLLACQTDPNFARQLAAALNVPVTASRSDVWVDTNGNVFASNTAVDNGQRRPGWPPNGEFVTFGPNGAVLAVHGPYPPGPPPTWGAHHPDYAPEAYQRGSDEHPAGPGDGPADPGRPHDAVPPDAVPPDSTPADGPADPGAPADEPAGQQVTFADGTTYQTQFDTGQLDASTGFPANLDQILANAGVSRAEFDRLRNQSIEDFVGNQADIDAMHRIRDQITAQPGEMLQRALTSEAAANLLGNTWIPGPPFTSDGGSISRPDRTGGFTARYADVAHLDTPYAVIEGLRLDYTDNGYIGRNGRAPYDFGDQQVAMLRFPFDPGRVDMGPNHTGPVTPDAALPIAYGAHPTGDSNVQPQFPMGGNGRVVADPFAGHGFTGSQDNPVPEFELHPHGFDQAEIWLADTSGNQVLLGAYDANLDNGPGNPRGGWRLTDEGQAYTAAQQKMVADHRAAQDAAAAAAAAKDSADGKPDDGPDNDPPAASGPAGPPPSDPPPAGPAAADPGGSGERTEPRDGVDLAKPGDSEPVDADPATMNLAAPAGDTRTVDLRAQTEDLAAPGEYRTVDLRTQTEDFAAPGEDRTVDLRAQTDDLAAPAQDSPTADLRPEEPSAHSAEQPPLPGAGAEFRMAPDEEGLSPAEQELRSRTAIGYEEFGDANHANPAYEVYFDNDTSAMYKPSAGAEDLREGIPVSQLAEREVAASRLDELLGFGLVPTTTMVDGPHGPGSLQHFVAATDGLEARDYPPTQQERMAVLDYIAGNTDRHGGNYMTAPDGSLVAIDHGYSFPEHPDPEYGIRSDFTVAFFQQPLSAEVLSQVRAIEPDTLRATLRGMGLSEVSVEGAVGRLVEIQAHGMINGEAWSGRLKDAWLLTVRGSRE